MTILLSPTRHAVWNDLGFGGVPFAWMGPLSSSVFTSSVYSVFSLFALLLMPPKMNIFVPTSVAVCRLSGGALPRSSGEWTDRVSRSNIYSLLDLYMNNLGWGCSPLAGTYYIMDKYVILWRAMLLHAKWLTHPYQCDNRTAKDQGRVLIPM